MAAELPTMRQLRLFLALVETGHFGRAAQRCFVSPSTFSGAIKKMETTLGVRLLDRETNGVKLTPAGEDIVPLARAVLGNAEEMLNRCKRPTRPRTVKLGVIPTIGPYMVPSVLERLNRAAPDVRVSIVEDRTADLVRGLQQGRVDMGILALPAYTGGLNTEKLFDEELMLCVSKEHPLARVRMIRADDIQRHRLIVLKDGHCLRDHALVVCGGARSGSNEIVECSSITMMLQMISMNEGVALLPRMATNAELKNFPDIKTRPIIDMNVKRTIALCWLAPADERQALAPAIDALVAACRANPESLMPAA